MKSGEDWIESSGKRALEKALVAPLMPAMGGLAVADRFAPATFQVQRSHYPGNIFTMDKLGNPRSNSFVSRWLRKAMIDELPQALEVWRGNMSLIGPRADTPEQMAALFEAIDDADLRDEWKEARFKQRPGIISAYAIHSHRNNLEGLPESERYSEESLVANAPLRARLDIEDFHAASFGHDVMLLGDTARMAAANYGHYLQRLVLPARPQPEPESSSIET